MTGSHDIMAILENVFGFPSTCDIGGMVAANTDAVNALGITSDVAPRLGLNVHEIFLGRTTCQKKLTVHFVFVF